MKHNKLKIASICALSCAFCLSAMATPSPEEARLDRLEKEIQVLKAELQKEKAEQKADKKVAKERKTKKKVVKTENRVYPEVSKTIRFNPQYNGNDLIDNLSSTHRDMELLEYRRNIPDFSGLQLSGYIQGAVSGQDYYVGNRSNPYTTDSEYKSDINVTGGALDIVAMDGWLSGIFKLSYDNGAGQASMRRVNNSKFNVEDIAMTIGDFTKAPFFASIGQFDLPFGKYSTSMILDPLTKTIGKTRERAINVGFLKNGFYGSAYVFKGDNLIKRHKGGINDGGVNLGYSFSKGDFSFGMDAGVILNLADSLGYNSYGSPWIGVNKRVKGGDVNVSVGYKNLHLISEWVGALNKFDAKDYSYNGKGASPKAFYSELEYQFKTPKPFFVGAGYGHSWQAAWYDCFYNPNSNAISDMPKSIYSAVLGGSIFRNTEEKIEYRHDKGYQGYPWSKRNTVVAQIDLYF